MIKNILTFTRCFFIFIFFTSVASYADTFSDQINTMIEQTFPQASISILIKEADTNQIIYEKNSKVLLMPASGSKLFTAAAALHQLKPNFYLSTRLSQKGSDYYITFEGSPSLKTSNLIGLIETLSAKGVKEIQGDIIIDNTRFEPPSYSAATSIDDLGWSYSPPITGIALNGNEVLYQVTTKALGTPAQIVSKTPNTALKIINEVQTVSPEEAKHHCNLNLQVSDQNTIRLYGCVAKKEKPQELQLAIPNPTLMAKNIITNALKTNHIVLKGTIKEGKTPEGAQGVASYCSKNLVGLITYMLQESDNLYANSLFLQLAYALTHEGTFKQGTYAINKILKENTHLDMSQVFLADGAGGRYNLTTTEQITTLLSDMYQNENLKSLYINALAQAGVSGNLKDRMKKTLLEKKVFAKTGTMHDVSSLSGYYIAPTNKVYIFSIITNGVTKPITKAKQFEDKVLQVFAENLQPK